MNGKQGLGRLWRWIRARPDAHAALDAADVGTAFGMELSIEAEQREARDTQANPPVQPTDGAARSRR